MANIAQRAKAVFANQQALLLLVLLAMVAFFTSQNHIFFTNAVFGNIISDWSPIVLIAIGETFVIISGGIDLSVGSTVAVSGVVAAFAMRNLTTHGSSPTTTLLIGLAVAAGIGFLVGAINAFLITKTNVVPFIATLVTMGAGSGLAIVFTGGGPIGGGPDEAIRLSVPKVGPFSYPGLVIVLIVIALGLFLHKARFGRYTYAIGSNEFAARSWYQYKAPSFKDLYSLRNPRRPCWLLLLLASWCWCTNNWSRWRTSSNRSSCNWWCCTIWWRRPYLRHCSRRVNSDHCQ